MLAWAVQILTHQKGKIFFFRAILLDSNQEQR